MNIWILNHYAILPDLPGGTRHYDFGRELARRGHQVTVFASSFHHGIRRETRLRPREGWAEELRDGVRFIWVKTPPYDRNDWRRAWNMLTFMVRCLSLGRRLPRLVSGAGRPEVVIGSSVHLLAVLAGYRLARHHRARFVMEVRDLWPQTLIDMGVLPPKHPIISLLKKLERFLYGRSLRIISLLPAAAEYFVECGIPEDRIVWIPNAVDLSVFPILAGGSTAADESLFRVMYLGAHGSANHLDILIQAAASLQERCYSRARLVLVGDGPEKARLRVNAAERGLHNVEFHDSIPKGNVPGAIAESDALIFHLGAVDVLRYGISSNKLFDYMASSKPILFCVAALNNPVRDAGCGLTVPPDDPEALAEAIVQLAERPREEREMMGKRGRAYIEEHHDIRKLAERLERVLIDSLRSQK